MDSSYLVVCLLSAFLSYTTTMLNIVTIHAIRKTSSLSQNFKTLLLSLAVSDLSVGLLAQPMRVIHLISTDWNENNETSATYNAIYIALLLLANLFIFATLFLVTVLCAERLMAIHFYLRYQELVTHKRVVAVVVSIWILSGLFSLTRLWITKSIMYVVFGVAQSGCIIAATFFSIRIYMSVRLHVNEIQVLQLQHTATTYVLTVCYLPNICTLFAVAFTSRPSTGIKHLQFYTLTLEFLNSSLNPVIYCWNMIVIKLNVVTM